MNKLLTGSIAALALCAMNAAYAQKGAVYAPAPCGETSWYHSGFYVGGAVGGNLYLANLEQNTFASFESSGPLGSDDFRKFSPFFTVSNDDLELQAHQYGFMGQIQLGYAYVNNWFFGAIEVSGNGSGGTDLDQNINIGFGENFDPFAITLNSDTDVEMNEFEPVVDLKLGFKVTPNSVVYARVGAAFNEIELSNTFTFFEDDLSGDTITQTLGSSGSENVVGLRLGIGGEHRFSENVAVTLDYVHTNYYGDVDVANDKDIDTLVFDGSDFDTGFLSTSQEVNISRDTVMLGLNYYF